MKDIDIDSLLKDSQAKQFLWGGILPVPSHNLCAACGFELLAFPQSHQAPSEEGSVSINMLY